MRERIARKDNAVHTGFPVRNVQRVILANCDLPESSIPIRKKGSVRPKKTFKSTDRLLKRTVIKNPVMTAKEIKEVMALKLVNVSVRAIQHHLQKNLKLPSRFAMKPPITDKMMKKRVAFAKKFQHWTPEQWGKVMFSDESSFRALCAVQRKVRRPIGSYRYSSHYTVKTMKYLDSVMVWACFTGDVGRRPLLPS